MTVDDAIRGYRTLHRRLRLVMRMMQRGWRNRRTAVRLMMGSGSGRGSSSQVMNVSTIWQEGHQRMATGSGGRCRGLSICALTGHGLTKKRDVLDAFELRWIAEKSVREEVNMRFRIVTQLIGVVGTYW